MRTRQYTYGRPARSGFTLIELLVVIGIIGLLIGITLVIGFQVTNGGRKNSTQDTIRVLDSALEAYIKATDGNPAPTVADPLLGPNVLALAADVYDPTAGVMMNSVCEFMYQASLVPDAKGVLDSLPQKYVQLRDIDGPGPHPRLTALDGWNRPIRYVHPAFQGDILGDISTPNPTSTQPRPTDQVVGPATAPQTYAMTSIRRNHTVANGTVGTLAPDSDGGTCPSPRPYFYSAGQDGLVGWELNTAGSGIANDFNADNVYTNVPKPAVLK
jgi:prepilin-type N-terminal cleavage/methylation domain-containing protein